jgi:hypothetical protein
MARAIGIVKYQKYDVFEIDCLLNAAALVKRNSGINLYSMIVLIIHKIMEMNIEYAENDGAKKEFMNIKNRILAHQLTQ